LVVEVLDQVKERLALMVVLTALVAVAQPIIVLVAVATTVVATAVAAAATEPRSQKLISWSLR
jgi:hypothetical protein